MHVRRLDQRVLLLCCAAIGVGAVLIALGLGSVLLTRGARGEGYAPIANATTSGLTSNGATVSATLGSVAASSGIATQTPLSLVLPDTPIVTGPAIDAYEGLGSWVDIYDSGAWKSPKAAVRDMASHGVKTLFVETGNYGASYALFNPAALSLFITEAHANNMKVVAWYLPDMKPKSTDLSRISQAINFTTPDGQKFDSFALDIESTAISSNGARNKALRTLSTKIRALVGPSYPLGAIIPSPVGMNQKKGYWNVFPYKMVAGIYDVIMPMSYYTYHTKDARGAYADTMANVRILRAQPGCARIPIHLIGGISESSKTSQVQAFARAVRQTQCFGASLYGWPGTSAPMWKALSTVGK